MTGGRCFRGGSDGLFGDMSKRSAIVTLAGILEEHRALLKDQLGKDEGALFEIANRYALRHRKADQRGDL